MTLEEIALTYADKGFAYLVAIYLLWRYHTTDREYLRVLQRLTDIVEAHVRQKDETLERLKDTQKK